MIREFRKKFFSQIAPRNSTWATCAQAYITTFCNCKPIFYEQVKIF
nr:MAG TPA: hypothetical protein [Caudoviricetes sp.]